MGSKNGKVMFESILCDYFHALKMDQNQKGQNLVFDTKTFANGHNSAIETSQSHWQTDLFTLMTEFSFNQVTCFQYVLLSTFKQMKGILF